jgi:hypothetical protein
MSAHKAVGHPTFAYHEFRGPDLAYSNWVPVTLHKPGATPTACAG